MVFTPDIFLSIEYISLKGKYWYTSHKGKILEHTYGVYTRHVYIYMTLQSIYHKTIEHTQGYIHIYINQKAHIIKNRAHL